MAANCLACGVHDNDAGTPFTCNECLDTVPLRVWHFTFCAPCGTTVQGEIELVNHQPVATIAGARHEMGSTLGLYENEAAFEAALRDRPGWTLRQEVLLYV